MGGAFAATLLYLVRDFCSDKPWIIDFFSLRIYDPTLSRGVNERRYCCFDIILVFLQPPDIGL